MKNYKYSPKFYSDISIGAKHSASLVVPYISSLLNPKSVIDVGCGSGEWLKIFKEYGARTIQGLDGPWVPTEDLVISSDCFKTIDLNQPSWHGKKFDLCISLEVAEHLLEESADQFVRFLTNLSSTILFSAAIPRQGGTNHFNEQWQSYWIHKFETHGFKCFDPVRPKFWENAAVAIHYKQNSFVFTNDTRIAVNLSQYPCAISDIIHPDHYIPVTEPLKYLTRHNIMTHYLPNLLNKIKKKLS